MNEKCRQKVYSAVTNVIFVSVNFYSFNRYVRNECGASFSLKSVELIDTTWSDYVCQCMSPTGVKTTRYYFWSRCNLSHRTA